MSSTNIDSIVHEACNAAGLPVHGFVTKNTIAANFYLFSQKAYTAYRLSEAGGIVMALLPYNPDPDLEPPSSMEQGPYMKVGAFAAYNHYAILLRLLKNTAEKLSAAFSVSKKSFALAVNSRLPEKPLAVLAGLGRIGRSSLLINRHYGPACVIGAIILPGQIEIQNMQKPDTKDYCKDCMRCVNACPSHAIRKNGLVKEKCLQFWASIAGNLPKELKNVWGNMLYGCDECTKACLFSSKLLKNRGEPSLFGFAPKAAILEDKEKRPGRWISAPWLVTASEEEIKLAFKKTALGMSWISVQAMKRSASICTELHSGQFDRETRKA
ncbi:hypothetical protein MASR2M29_14960 [Spirochaetota bacterium]